MGSSLKLTLSPRVSLMNHTACIHHLIFVDPTSVPRPARPGRRPPGGPPRPLPERPPPRGPRSPGRGTWASENGGRGWFSIRFLMNMMQVLIDDFLSICIQDQRLNNQSCGWAYFFSKLRDPTSNYRLS